MYGALDISTSGMMAQRMRLTASAANVANKGSRYADGTPYRARQVVMTPGDPSAKSVDGKGWGVHVSEIRLDQTPFRMHLDPTSPYAQKSGAYKGYVLDSNVNSITEMVNQMEATRAYEANAVGAEATKLMIGQALRLLG